MDNGLEITEEGGELVYSGAASFAMTGRSSTTKSWDGVPADRNLLSFHRLKPLVGVKIARVFAGPVACHTVAIDTNGVCYVWGRNENGQLGLGNTVNRYNPTKLAVPTGEKLSGAALGSQHTILWTTRGHAFAMGANQCGQLGIGKKKKGDVLTPYEIASFVDKRIISAGCGREFSIAVDSFGGVYAMGCPQYGQLGNGTEGETLERAGKITYANEMEPVEIVGDLALSRTAGSRIVKVACGANHSMAMDTDGRVYTWGFGGYGRLGHGDVKNALEPRAVELFSKVSPPPDPNLPSFMQRKVPEVRASVITCGGTASFAVAREPYFSLYQWGITKKSGECDTRPTMLDQVQGWRIRAVACGNTSIVIGSASTLIAWGPGPTFGELGYGPDGPKSSTKSKEVLDLKGTHVMAVAAGYGHSAAIIHPEKFSAKEKLAALGVFAPDEVSEEYLPKPGDGKKGKKKKKSTKKRKKADEGDDDSAKRAKGDEGDEDEE